MEKQETQPSHVPNMREDDVAHYAMKLEARIIQIEAENSFVRDKIAEYIKSGFDPGMMAPTLDDIRHGLKIEAK